ncbi:helix-turn-helix domain-containing protein [Mycolicibacterium austroafricanum]|nr:helix-turn-helix domain-containing protein [Mycolicibacterium austroafricanum]QRZ09769.1 helix-turn-helix domain-containing protein [Mycolicibacterium austroafricanum]QZT71218.1 helix-turn-helix domain-containing protein [Mycolicibacterium austroafricanum]QZY48946.1 helix-turn-helix domain-containing protein [Mycolicibacterium austroafricanum]
MTVAGLLDESLMSGAHVLTGADRLDQQVHWVLPLSEVMSRHDALDGVAVYTRPEALLGNGGTLAPLAARGATALLVDGTVPADFPTGAVPADMVVVEMAFPVGFAALNRLLAERALSQEVHAMRYATHVHASLAGLFHRGAGLQLLVREVSNLARNPAMALDARGNVVAHNGFTAETAAALTESILPLLTADLPAAARLSAHHDTRVERFGAPGGGVWTVISTAIRLGKAFEGWVLVVVPSAEPGGHDLARHIVVTEQATAIIGSEMLRQHSVDEAEERARGDFVQALVHGHFSSEHDMRARADYHEIDIDSVFGVFVAPGAVPRGVDNPAASMVRLARYAANVAPDPAVRSYVTVLGDVLVVVRSLRGADDTAMRKEMTRYAEAMADELQNRRGTPAAVAYSRPARGAQEVAGSYREARIALGIARRLGHTGAVSYQDLRSFTVLADVADTDQSRALVADVLGPLRSAPDLLDFLIGYLAHGGNVNATARALNVHRNTMLTKLDRVSRATGLDIRLPDNQFTVWLAIRLDMLTEVHAAVDREAKFR